VADFFAWLERELVGSAWHPFAEVEQLTPRLWTEHGSAVPLHSLLGRPEPEPPATARALRPVRPTLAAYVRIAPTTFPAATHRQNLDARVQPTRPHDVEPNATSSCRLRISIVVDSRENKALSGVVPNR
jgi:hypothetical protein